jgi:hypothetical protein
LTSKPTDGRPPTPPDVALALRKEAGFGCCVCGGHIIKYHHIIPWNIEHHFRPEDMMVLCPNHHDEADSAIPESKQRKYKARPCNIKNGYAHGRIIVNAERPVLSTGATAFVPWGDLLLVDGEKIIGLSRVEEGLLELTLSLYDRDDTLVVEIAGFHFKVSSRGARISTLSR